MYWSASGQVSSLRGVVDIGEGPNLPFIFFNKLKQWSNDPVKLDISPHIFSKRQVFSFCFKGKRVGEKTPLHYCCIKQVWE